MTRWAEGKPEIVGEVKPGLVRIGMLHARSNGTRFEGAIIPRESGSAVVGRFIAHKAARGVAGVFLAVAAMFALIGLLGSVREMIAHPHSLAETLRLLLGLIGWLAGVGLFAFIQIWNVSPTRKDVVALSAAIEEALKSGPP